MNRKLLVSLGIVVFLIAVIVINKWEPGSGVKGPGVIETPADEISVRAEGYSLKLVKSGDRWLINDQKYPADTGLVTDLEKKVSEVKLLDLISEKGYFNKYDLAEDKGVEVTLSAGGKQLRKLMIGKQGLTNSQVYVRIDDSNEVYLASGLTSEEMRPEADTLRDRKILEVSVDEVASFVINYKGREFFFLKEDKKVEAADTQEDEKKSAPAEALWVCKGFESVKLDSRRINNILRSFSPLRAASFPDTPVTGSILCTVKINTPGKEYNLKIYSKKEKEMYFAVSPESPYVFTLGGWQTEKFFIKDIKDFEKKKDAK
ncbi:MAG TPA: DUF4340 domain-containing protein [Spirochaetota bacterium]|nr:DUF4340 domain-containing protein [Spirochaetota bacterium]HPJ33844.1 DUF4340 domain-containing protein [Spirochaetota bacterium]